jgi:hypothetical protein
MVGANDVIHVWQRCHGCGAQPIVGPCFECQTCPSGPDNALCNRCYGSLEARALTHPASESYAALLGIAIDRPHDFKRVEGSAAHDCASWLTVRHPAAAAPVIADGFIVRPEFCVGRESFMGSYAFAIGPAPTLLLTALHILSHLSMSKRIDCSPRNDSYSGRELPAMVTKVNLYDVFHPNWMATDLGYADKMLVLPNARLGDDEPFSQRDIAAFRPHPSARLTPTRLAKRPPRVGDPVWLALRPEPGARERAAACVVVEQTDQTLIFRYAASHASEAHTSGAPLVDIEGEVVGINIGRGRFEGAHFGHANHVASIRRHLEAVQPSSFT